MTSFASRLSRRRGSLVFLLRSLVGASLVLAPTGALPARPAGSHAAAPAARAARAAPPSRRSLERALNWGIGAIDADAAYAQGATGRGVTVALIDTGVSAAGTDLLAGLSDKSIDVVADRGEDGGARHGAQTASLLAARHDGRGSLGVAYDATILSVRVDTAGSCSKACRINGTNLARGIDYAVEQGARIIALPLEAPNRLSQIEPALVRAVEAGALLVTAAGNHGDPEPSWPARYAADPRFAGSIVIAGATTPSGRVARWASKATGAEHRYLVAPGQNLVTNCGRRSCAKVSGTSYAVSFVAGAAALLLERYPQLRGPELATLLLDSAVDLGAPGADPVSGTGMLNVARAMRLARTQLAAGASGGAADDRS
ncbi:S8 family peptidase [Sphingomonas parva]|uniref:S8 family peptidase n=1 Tax=Sphingomonas parva TaxID=2555898 RepID=UPI001CDCF460|nr:S8 family peptidase [Sphingomonas parva]